MLDRFRIPATNSLTSSDMLRASLRAWSSSFQRCLILSSRLAGLRLCPMYGPLGHRVLPGACAGPCCLPLALRGAAHGHPEGGCECCPSSCFPRWGSLSSCQSPGHCPTGSCANTALVWSGLLACPDVPSLVRMTLGAF